MTTDTDELKLRAVASTCSTSEAPPTWCKTFALRDFMRVPLPAARISTRRSDMVGPRKSGHFQDGSCQPFRVVANDSILAEQVSLHDPQTKIRQPIAAELD